MKSSSPWRLGLIILAAVFLTACQAAPVQSPLPVSTTNPVPATIAATIAAIVPVPSTPGPTPTVPVIGPKGEILDLQGFIQRTHDPMIVKENGKYYVYSTGSRIPFICSSDMLNWEFCGRVFEKNLDWFRDINPNLVDIWAPDVTYFNNQWYLYYAISNFGEQNSAIALATNTTLDPKSPQYKWVDQGIVLRSKPGDDWNAIDPALVLDENKQPWLAWGSFWNGIYMRKVDAASGMLDETDTTVHHLADRNPGPDNTSAIEATFIVPHAGKWYLFVSFDQCCNGVSSTYNVHIGRSDTVTGPYVDRAGVPLLKGGGSLLLSAYDRWRGPGHNSVLIEGDTYWIAYHAYDAKQIGIPKLRIESIAWDAEGWPVLASQTTKP